MYRRRLTPKVVETRLVSSPPVAVLILTAIAGIVHAGASLAEELPSNPSPISISAWIKDEQPQAFATRPLSSLHDLQLGPRATLTSYGALRVDAPHESTGFFYARKIGQRWWLVDPDGYPFLHVAVNSVKPGGGPTFREAFPKKFRDQTDWAQQTTRLLHEHGFNGTGCWSADELLSSASPRPVYARLVSFMASFGRKLRITRQGSGHTLYPNQLFPVFHPEFPAHCRQVAEELKSTKDDPYLLGIFSDNELVRNRTALDLHLSFAADSPERKASEAWLRARQDGAVVPVKITDEDRLAYVGFMFETYFSIVRAAIDEVDPHHLYLGSRLHGWDKENPHVWAAAGKHVDVIAVNVYRLWTPRQSVESWVRWSGKPVIVTEFYAKGADSGMPNLSGAGWTVPSQHDRGLFYQHFTLSLLASRGCVGWHYFKYVDNDLQDTTTDPSNRDSNKGILTARYEPWPELLQAMKDVNDNVYSLVSYFDRDHR